MPAYDDDALLRDARARYFETNGFGDDGGYAKAWVKVKAGPLRFAFPNSDARRRAVRFHDLHHVVTGYGTDVVGEGEVGAWEIASSCRGFATGLVLNLLVFWMGLLVRAPRIYRAFVRGRHSQNLYQTFDGDFDGLLARTVGEVRGRLHLDVPTPPAGGSDRLAFGGWSLAAVVVGFWPVWIGLAGWWAWQSL